MIGEDREGICVPVGYFLVEAVKMHDIAALKGVTGPNEEGQTLGGGVAEGCRIRGGYEGHSGQILGEQRFDLLQEGRLHERLLLLFAFFFFFLFRSSSVLPEGGKRRQHHHLLQRDLAILQSDWLAFERRCQHHGKVAHGRLIQDLKPKRRTRQALCSALCLCDVFADISRFKPYYSRKKSLLCLFVVVFLLPKGIVFKRTCTLDPGRSASDAAGSPDSSLAQMP